MKNFTEQKIQELFSNENSIIFKQKSLEDLNSNDIHELNCFHMNEIDLLILNDNYFCGLRAEHFCIEYGYSEADSDGRILISANHKGIRLMTLLRF